MIEDFGAARAPARGRFRLFAHFGPAAHSGGTPGTTVGLVDAVRDRSIQINLVSSHRRILGVWRRPALRKAAWACERDDAWLLAGGMRVDLRDADGRPAMRDVLVPLRAAGPDLATALVLLRAESEHIVTVPPDGRQVRLTTTVDGRVLRVDVHDDEFHTPVFVAPADAPDHDLVPETWPPLSAVPPPGGVTEYARFLPPLWRAAADLLRDAGRAG